MRFARASLLMIIVTMAAIFVLNLCGRATLKSMEVGTARAKADSLSTSSTRPDFDKEIKPIFQGQCQPCHFQGGKVYDHLPFDRPETITKLGKKLFTRIKDEKDKRLISEFLGEP